MHYSKSLLIALLITSHSVFCQENTNTEKAIDTVKQTESKLDIPNQIGDPRQLIPTAQRQNETGHTPKTFFEKQAQQFETIKQRLDEQGMLKGVNADGTATHIPMQIEQNFLPDQEAKLKAMTQRFADAGMLDGFDAQTIANRTQQFRDAAQLLAEQSNQGMVNALQEELGINFSPSQQQQFDPNAVIEPGELSAIFISFNMSPNALKRVIKLGAEENIPLYLKGMHPDDLGIHDTIRRLRFLGMDLDVKPDVRFKPRYFEQYNIHSAPTVFVRNSEGASYASGITNIGWLQTKFEREGPNGYLGAYGDAVEVTEQDIREVFRERFEAIDYQGKKQQVIDSFWQKQEFQTLPPATKDDVWYIDPTVSAAKDIINPRGDQLAVKGQILNPLDEFPVPLTLYVFDATDNRQLEWVAANHRSGQGQVMLIFSALNRDKGWDHLSALRNYFGTELYKLPKELVQRFDITSLPVTITTDLQRKLMKVSQHDMTITRQPKDPSS